MVSDSPPTLAASVIVPTRGRPELLMECVQSILEGVELPRELVIIDQSDAPDTNVAALGNVRGCAVRYHHSSTRGVSAARNEACRLAAEDILVFTDDDVLVAPDWLGTTVRCVLDDPTSTLITGRVLPLDKDVQGGFAPTVAESDEPSVYRGRIWNDVLPSNNMAFTREIYDRLGPFDVRLGVGGTYRSATDNDYCYRALEAGYSIRYAPEAVVYHQMWRPKKSYRHVRWIYGVGQGAYFTKHIHLRDRYTLIRLRNEIFRHARIALDLRSQSNDDAKDEAAYVLGLIYGSARWLLFERLRGR